MTRKERVLRVFPVATCFDRLRAVRKLLEENGCDCECEHHHEEHGDDCERCLACRIGEAVGK